MRMGRVVAWATGSKGSNQGPTPVSLSTWRPKWLSRAGLHQLDADGLAVDVAEPVILDGEAFPPGRYRVEQGPELTFVST